MNFVKFLRKLFYRTPLVVVSSLKVFHGGGVLEKFTKCTGKYSRGGSVLVNLDTYNLQG